METVGAAEHWRHRTRLYDLLLLSTLAAALLLHNLSKGSLPPFDDTTYSLVSKTILKTGDWITMRWLDIPYFVFGKPPLDFWLTALFYKMLGISEFTARLSSAIHGVVGVIVTYFIGTLYSRRVGMTAALFLLSFPDYFRLSQSAMLDVPLTVHMSLSLLFYLFACRTQIPLWYCMSGIGMGLAVMTKSVVGLIPIFIICLFHLIQGQARQLLTCKFGMLVGSAAVVVLPWHAVQYILYGRPFLTKYVLGTVSYNALEVLVSSQRSSVAFYIRTLHANDPIHWILFVCSTPLLFGMALRKSRESLLLLLYTTFLFLLFSVSQTRMAWYIAPAFPAMAVSSAHLLSKFQEMRLGPIISIILAGVFVYSVAVLSRSDHWYLRGDPDLKQIVLDFKAQSSPSDVLFCYNFGEPVNTGPFYGDRKVVYVSSSKDELKIQERIGDYLEAGLFQFVQDEDDLIHKICSTPHRHLILRSGVYQALKAKLKLQGEPIAENRSYVVLRLACGA